MKTASVLGADLALLAAPAHAQYGDGGQNAGGPLGSYARRAGINYGSVLGGVKPAASSQAHIAPSPTAARARPRCFPCP